MVKQRISVPRVRNISTFNDKDLIKTFNNFIHTAKVRIDPYYYQKAIVKKVSFNLLVIPIKLKYYLRLHILIFISDCVSFKQKLLLL